MSKQKNNARSIVGAGALLGEALSPRELEALGTAARARLKDLAQEKKSLQKGSEERQTVIAQITPLKLAIGKMRRAERWKATHVASKGI